MPASPPTPWTAQSGCDVQAALVDLLGDERAHGRVHPPRPVQEEPALGRDGRVLAEQVLEHAQARAFGVRGLRDVGELQRVAEQDQVARRRARRQARPRARAAPPRRSRGSRAARRPSSGANSQDVPATSLYSGSKQAARRCLDHCVRQWLGHGRPLPLARAAEGDALRRARRARPRREVVDRLVAHGGDADALAAVDQVDDQPRAGPRLAGTGRALDEEGARVERAREPAAAPRGRSSGRRAGRDAREPRRLAREHVAAARGSAPLAVAHGDRERAAAPPAARRSSSGTPAISARGSASPARLLPAPDDERARASSTDADVHALAGRRIDPVARRDLVLLRGEAEAYTSVVAAVPRLAAPARGSRPPRRRRQLLSSFRQVEEAPPGGPGLAAVVLEQLAGEPARRALRRLADA